MPNWCDNKLTVTNATPEFLEYLRNEGFSFEKMSPPDRPENDEDGFGVLAAQTKAWGTKWDLDEKEQKEIADSLCHGEARFLTAWSPPIQAIEALSVKFPEVDFVLYYFEGGCWFWGTAEINNGFSHESSYESFESSPTDFLMKYMDYDEETANQFSGNSEE